MNNDSKTRARRRRRYTEHMVRTCGQWVAKDKADEFKADVKDLAEASRKHAEPGEYHELMENREYAKALSALSVNTLEGES